VAKDKGREGATKVADARSGVKEGKKQTWRSTVWRVPEARVIQFNNYWDESAPQRQAEKRGSEGEGKRKSQALRGQKSRRD